MIYELTLQSVKTKLNLFNPPAKIINSKELTCAVGMAYRQSGTDLFEADEGVTIKELRDKCFADIPDMDEKLKTMISDYDIKQGEVLTADALITLKLGYDKS